LINPVTGQGRAIFGHKFTPDHVIDVIVEKAGYYLPSDDSADGSVDDGVEYAEYFTAHLIIYPKLVAPKRGGTVLHTNPNENCETLVDVMTDLLDSLFERAECIKYVSAILAVLLEGLPTD
jgi:hypothetical protein